MPDVFAQLLDSAGLMRRIRESEELASLESRFCTAMTAVERENYERSGKVNRTSNNGLTHEENRMRLRMGTKPTRGPRHLTKQQVAAIRRAERRIKGEEF